MLTPPDFGTFSTVMLPEPPNVLCSSTLSFSLPIMRIVLTESAMSYGVAKCELDDPTVKGFHAGLDKVVLVVSK
jgi:hypothetical protein